MFQVFSDHEKERELFSAVAFVMNFLKLETIVSPYAILSAFQYIKHRTSRRESNKNQIKPILIIAGKFFLSQAIFLHFREV